MKARARELTGILVQFLNKCDLLQKKLARGVRVYDYVPSFGDRPNDAPTTAKCAFAVSPPASLIHSADTCLVRLDALPDFRQQFRDYLLRYSPQQRGFYSYLTSVVVRCLPSSQLCSPLAFLRLLGRAPRLRDRACSHRIAYLLLLMP